MPMFKNLSPSALAVTGHQSEVIELALTYGFEGMDLDVKDFAGRVRRKGMQYARRLIDSAKIRLGTFVLPVALEAEDEQFAAELEKLPEMAQAAAEVGCPRCVVTLQPAGDERPYHENFEFHRRRLEETCRALDGAGVRLGVGFQAGEFLRKGKAFQFVHDLDALLLLVSMVGRPNIGLLLDTWDFVVGGGDLAALGKLPVEQIVAVQVAEVPVDVPPAELDEKSRLLPDAENGRVDVPAFLRALAAMGYEGPVTPKPSRAAFATRRRERIVRRAGEAMDNVWKAAELPAERVLSLPAGAE